MAKCSAKAKSFWFLGSQFIFSVPILASIFGDVTKISTTGASAKTASQDKLSGGKVYIYVYISYLSYTMVGTLHKRKIISFSKTKKKRRRKSNGVSNWVTAL